MRERSSSSSVYFRLLMRADARRSAAAIARTGGIRIAALLAAPPTTDALFAAVLDAGLENTWKLVAERGIYAFDSDPNGGPYRLVSAPRRAATLAELPPLVSRIAVVLYVCISSRDELSSSELASAVVEPREDV